MTSNPFGSSARHQYFLEVELSFNTLRRSASLLSPADWKVAKSWFERGVPLTVVQSALENVFQRRAERQESRRIQSLSYCEPAVDNAFQHLQELGYGELPTPEAVPIAQRLEDLIDAAGEFGQAHREVIMGCATGTDSMDKDPAGVERRLAALEIQLARTALESKPERERVELLAELEQRVAGATEPLRSRLDAETLARTRERTRGRVLKELIGHPRLSLFN